MNKYIFTALAVCLVCTHAALVKRQLPNPVSQFGRHLQKINPVPITKATFVSIINNAQKAPQKRMKRHLPPFEQIGDKLQKVFDPFNITRGVFDLLGNSQKSSQSPMKRDTSASDSTEPFGEIKKGLFGLAEIPKKILEGIIPKSDSKSE